MTHLTHYKSLFAMLLFLIGTTLGYTQNADFNWSAESYYLTANEVPLDLTSNLSKQGTSFTWEQVGYNTTKTNVYTVTSTTGQWNSEDHTGQVSYTLSSNNATASLTITGTEEEIMTTLILHGDSNNPDYHYVFTIATITNL